MTLRVGVIGTGNIGADHVRRIAAGIAGAVVSAVTDVDTARAEEVGRSVGATVCADGRALIAAAEVDAVIIASPSKTHAALTLACISAGKPVLCEKPLAPTTKECIEVLDAEVALGRRLVQVGFMRRYDSGYRAVKAALTDGLIGQPLILHNVHRNPTVPASFSSDMTITDAIIHEIDTTRWLLGEEIVSAQVIPPAPTPLAHPHLQDPQFVVFRTERGLLSTVECFVNCQYGYDVRCELVGSTGTASLVNPVVAAVTLEGADRAAVPADWRVRFGAAYHAELQDWVNGLLNGVVRGPNAWDGYAATRVAQAGVESATSGERVALDSIPKPALYA